jgi:pimeloyl-ACP methyl ester carboxylesterase
MPTRTTNPTPAHEVLVRAAASGAATSESRRVVLTGMEGVPVPAGVIDAGSGTPVVFLHGLVGLNDHWESVAASIQHRCRCIMLELPLLDLTGEDCSIQGATELTARFLRSYLPDQPAVLVGNSFGGHVAAKLAIEHQALVRGLVLAGASGLIEKSMVSDIQIKPSREWLERKIGELFHDKSKMNMGDVDRAFAELSHKSKARAMVRLSRTARRNHLGDQLASISAPTLIIWGRQDIVTPPEACEQFQAKVRGSRVVWIDNCGHAPMIEADALFARALNDFLDSVARASSP